MECRACGGIFRTTRVGRAAFYCRTPECDAARKRAEKLRQWEQASERKRLRRLEAGKRKRVANMQRKMRAKGLEMFRPIYDDPDQLMMVDDTLEISEAAAKLKPSKQNALVALVHLKHAEGLDEYHKGWQELAAAALRMADHTRPRAMHEPDIVIREEAIT